MKFDTDTEDGVVLPLFNNRGEVVGGTLIDAEDAEWLSSVTWHKHRNGKGDEYVRNYFQEVSGMSDMRMPNEIGKRHNFYVEGQVIDHINRDTLDNRKCNLRAATHSQNEMNKGLQCNNTSGYKGVRLGKSLTNPWEAYIKKDRIRHYLGVFATKIEAAHAYNAAAIELHGDFARLNEIEGE